MSDCSRPGHVERRPDGYCRECDRERARARYAANKQEYKDNAKAWRQANPEQYRASTAAYHKRHQDKHRASAKTSYEKDKARAKARSKAWCAANPEKRKAVTKRWNENNREQLLAAAKAAREADPGRELAKVRKRQTALANRLPVWADLQAIRAIYREAASLTKETGIQHHVDHEIPLRGLNVSGLHVHNNLKVVTATANLKKGNAWEP